MAIDSVYQSKLTKRRVWKWYKCLPLVGLGLAFWVAIMFCMGCEWGGW